MSTKRLEVRNADDFDKNVLISNNSIPFNSYFIGSEHDSMTYAVENILGTYHTCS